MASSRDWIEKRRQSWAARAKRVDEFLTSRGIEPVPCGFYVGAGWQQVVEDALDRMIAVGWNKELDQVKSKFCSLRIYIGKASDDVFAIIDETTALCDTMCEECGKPHELIVPRSGTALCETCKEGENYG